MPDGNLERFWRKAAAQATAEYDQKAMLARELIAENWGGGTEEDAESIRAIINHFANDDRAAISLMGVLAQVGLAAIAREDCGED
jgi:hypothetical protein